MFRKKASKDLLTDFLEARHNHSEKLFSVAELANFNRDEQRAYQDSLKYYRDVKNAMDTMFEEGREEGLQEGREEGRQEEKITIARQMKLAGLSTDQIVSITGLTEDEVKLL